MSATAADGTVHAMVEDVQQELAANPDALALWQSLTPLGRNEYLCWVQDAKRSATRSRRVARLIETLREGKRRPCCWSGCIHRDDKAPGAWQQAVLVEKKTRHAR